LLKPEESYFAVIAETNAENLMAAMMLEKGADVNAQGGAFGTALQAAIAQDEKDIVGILLEKGTIFNIWGGIVDATLQVDTAMGKDKLAEASLENEANVSTQNEVYSTTLQVTAISLIVVVLAFHISRRYSGK
jgi:hypothetical protein